MKFPRHYAMDFMKATTKDQQREALAGCPKDWQSLVREHIRIARMTDAGLIGRKRA